jgi:hypothetical protein
LLLLRMVDLMYRCGDKLVYEVCGEVELRRLSLAAHKDSPSVIDGFLSLCLAPCHMTAVRQRDIGAGGPSRLDMTGGDC